jgi:hypothetical protein
MDIDLSLSGIENLVMAINAENPQADVLLTANKIDHQAPVPHGGSKPGNTDILISAKNNSGLRDSVTFNYGRVPLNSFTLLSPPVLYVNQTPSFSEIIQEFKNIYGVGDAIIQANDVTGPTAGTVNDAGINYVISAHGNSILWVGNITVTLRLKTISLNDIITDTDLDAFTFPVNP